VNYSAALQPDGNLVVAGATLSNDSLVFATTRYLTILPATCEAYFTINTDANAVHHYFALNLSYGIPPVTYEWSWGDGSFSVGDNVSHDYAQAGYYNICQTIT